MRLDEYLPHDSIEAKMVEKADESGNDEDSYAFCHRTCGCQIASVPGLLYHQILLDCEEKSKKLHDS